MQVSQDASSQVLSAVQEKLQPHEMFMFLNVNPHRIKLLQFNNMDKPDLVPMLTCGHTPIERWYQKLVTRSRHCLNNVMDGDDIISNSQCY